VKFGANTDIRLKTQAIIDPNLIGLILPFLSDTYPAKRDPNKYPA
jgi:hypothetical protein